MHFGKLLGGASSRVLAMSWARLFLNFGNLFGGRLLCTLAIYQEGGRSELLGCPLLFLSDSLLGVTVSEWQCNGFSNTVAEGITMAMAIP